MSLFYHPIYTDGIDPTARFPRDRYRLLAQKLSQPRYDSLIKILHPELARIDDIKLAHCPDYVDRFLTDALTVKERRRIGLRPWTSSIKLRTLRLMGGAVAALNSVVETGGFAGNMAGGTHHAHFDFGSGYCIFNDLAVCAKLAQSRFGLERVLIVDLDVHQGDGTAAILRSDPRIFTFSAHCSVNFPFRKWSSDLDLSLPRDIEDQAYLDALAPVIEQCGLFQPDIVFYQAGVDLLAADKLGKMNLSHKGLIRRNQMVFDLCAHLEVPCVLFMGGGYADPIAPTIEAFADLFLQAAKRHQQLCLQKQLN